MAASLSDDLLNPIVESLSKANQTVARSYPGETGHRQPVHTVYGGAHLFRADTAKRLGQVAERALAENAGDFVVFARALGLPLSGDLPDVLDYATGLKNRLVADSGAVRVGNKPAWLAYTIFTRVQEKLKREPVEDFRIDFEDGYGNRPDAEEDGHAASTAEQVAAGLAAGTLPGTIGIRIKTLSRELHGRSLRTLDLFVSTLNAAAKRTLPTHFVVTIP